MSSCNYFAYVIKGVTAAPYAVDLPYKQLREDTLHDLKLMNGSKSS
jgi:hypothetical protein